MPKIKNEKDFGKHCHNCNAWMPRRALRKELKCDGCGKSILRRLKYSEGYDRCIECDAIVLENFNYCEVCGCETPRGARIIKAKQLRDSFQKSKLCVTMTTATFSYIKTCSESSQIPDCNVGVTMDSDKIYESDSASFPDWNVETIQRFPLIKSIWAQPRLIVKQLFLQTLPDIEISLSDENIMLKGYWDDCRITLSYT